MSDIKIQPSATGSATVTLTAPATGTARTVTLPDGTGSLIADNGSGQVGIGTTTHYDNSTKLTVSGRINTTNGTATGSMNYGGGAVVNMGALTNHPVNLMVNNSTKWVIDTNGNLIAEGGGGIVLGNNSYAAANELDDYEEGTFTPVFKDTSNAVVNGTLYNASYTKIGQMVFISLYYSPGDVQNGYLMNMSLPFTASSANHRSAGSLWTYNGPIPEKSNQWLVQTNTAHASFWKLRDNQISPTMQWDNGTEIVLSIAYFTSQ